MRMYCRESVAPYVGAWIETKDQNAYNKMLYVAPYVGAWIETEWDVAVKAMYAKSHPTWVRGLKPYNNNGKYQYLCRTLRGCVD